jgi:hypothetical protein
MLFVLLLCLFVFQASAAYPPSCEDYVNCETCVVATQGDQNCVWVIRDASPLTDRCRPFEQQPLTYNSTATCPAHCQHASTLFGITAFAYCDTLDYVVLVAMALALSLSVVTFICFPIMYAKFFLFSNFFFLIR